MSGKGGPASICGAGRALNTNTNTQSIADGLHNAITNVDFMEALFPHLADGAAAVVCGFTGDPLVFEPSIWRARPWWHGKPLPGNVFRESNNYAGIASFWADAEGRYRRRKDQFAALHSVLIDDVGTKIPASRLRLPASAAIETSPGNFQHWLLLAEPETDAQRADRLIAALCNRLTNGGADPGMLGLTRVGRLPVGVNGKSKYRADGASFRCRTVEWNPERRYSVAAIAAAYGLDLLPAPPPMRRALPPGAATARVDGFAELLIMLEEWGLYIGPGACGWHHIVCPWANDHTDRATSGSAVSLPSAANFWAGGFRCHHGHCVTRSIGDVYRWARAARGAA
jgi:hypothetical protein